MNQPLLKYFPITIGLLVLLGSGGTQAYDGYQLAEQAEGGSRPPAVQPGASEQTPVPDAGGWSPWDEMRQMQEQMNRMFDEAFERIPTASPREWLFDGGELGPQITLDDQQKQYVVQADIPGAKQSDINVTLDGQLLTISARSELQAKETGDKGQVVGEATSVSSFHHAFTLPSPVEASRMQSEYKDGVLTVTIPKTGT